jgi:hypothetical protein
MEGWQMVLSKGRRKMTTQRCRGQMDQFGEEGSWPLHTIGVRVLKLIIFCIPMKDIKFAV